MKRFSALLLALFLLSLGGCARPDAQVGGLRVLCTTYPIYLFTTAVTQDVPGVEVSLLVNSQTSCLHDYTLTVRDMEAIDGADVIIMNGAGLEDFMADALAHSDAQVIDCSQSVTLLPPPDHEGHGHDGHDHEEEWDPHIWMDPRRAAGMMEVIADELSELDSAHSRTYWANNVAAYDRLGGLRQDIDVAEYQVYAATGQLSLDDVCATDQFITFHDGFQYFAQAYDLDLLKSIEEEEGATASAGELKELIALVNKRHIPAIFVEKNGSRASADVIARETGCSVYELDMLMSGDGVGIQPYIDGMQANLAAIVEALG